MYKVLLEAERAKSEVQQVRLGGRRSRGDKLLETNPEFVFLEVVSTPPMKDIMIGRVLLMAKRSHGPNGVLKRHRRSQVRRRVESLHVAGRMNDGYERVLSHKVGLMSV